MERISNIEIKELAETTSSYDLDTATEDIKRLYSETVTIGKKMALLVFQIGKTVFDAISHVSPKRATEWLENELPFTSKTAQNYVKIYVTFEQRQAELEELTIMQAYAVAGINARKELPAPAGEHQLQPGEEIFTAGKDGKEDKEATESPEMQRFRNEAKWLFKNQPLSGYSLKNYRVGIYDDRFFVFKEDGEHYLACDLLLPQTEALHEDYLELRTGMQVELEKYLSKIESIESAESLEADEPKNTKKTNHKKQGENL